MSLLLFLVTLIIICKQANGFATFGGKFLRVKFNQPFEIGSTLTDNGDTLKIVAPVDSFATIRYTPNFFYIDNILFIETDCDNSCCNNDIQTDKIRQINVFKCTRRLS